MRVDLHCPLWLLCFGVCAVGLLGRAQGFAAPQSSAGAASSHVVRSADLVAKGTATLTGNWTLEGDLHLGGDVHLTFQHAHVNLNGNMFLNNNAVLSIEDGSVFNLAQTQSFQYRMEAKDHSSLKITDSEFQTNAGKTNILLPASFVASDDASLVVKNAHLDYKRNWFLGAFNDRAKLISINTQYIPVEIYPSGECMIHVEGSDTKSLIWIKFLKGQFAVLDDLPDTSKPYTWSLGPGRPSKTNVKYEVDVKDAPLGINVESETGSDIRIANNKTSLGIGYHVEGRSNPVIGLEGSAERRSFSTTNGRKLVLVNSLVRDWQFYAAHSGQPVILKDSTINEAIANEGGIIHAENCKFLYGGLGTFGKGARFDADHSDIRAFSLLANHDSIVTIRDSVIHGSTIQASNEGRIVLLDDDITTNGNPYFGGANAPAHFVVQDKGVIIGLGLVPMKASGAGDAIQFIGDAFLTTHSTGLSGTYNLSYGIAGAGNMVAISQGALANLHAASLGSLQAGSLHPGSYIVTLKCSLSDGTQYEVARNFSVMAKESGSAR